MSEEFEADLIVLLDDDGEEHSFEILDTLDYEDKTYYALYPLFEDPQEQVEADGEYYIFEIVEEDGEEQLKQVSAYILTNMKPETRAFSANVKTTVKSGDDELKSVEMTYKEAKDYIEDLQKKAQEEAEQAEGGGAESGAEEESGSDAGEEEAAE